MIISGLESINDTILIAQWLFGKNYLQKFKRLLASSLDFHKQRKRI